MILSALRIYALLTSPKIGSCVNRLISSCCVLYACTNSGTRSWTILIISADTDAPWIILSNVFWYLPGSKELRSRMLTARLRLISCCLSKRLSVISASFTLLSLNYFTRFRLRSFCSFSFLISLIWATCLSVSSSFSDRLALEMSLSEVTAVLMYCLRSV